MKRINTVIIGGGQAGLAMSRCLAERGMEHVVLERGRVAQRWRERWDSMRLLTPNWQTRLPDWSYQGTDPDGFMTRRQVIEFLAAYARSFSAPVEAGVTVTAVEHEASRYRVTTSSGTWLSDNVVIATGNSDQPKVPVFGARLPGDIVQVVPSAYRKPSDLPPSGVLVVGASSTGVQLAEELQRSGRSVTLAVGHHTRLPRRYRGRDIQGWLDAIGSWDERAGEVRDLVHSRHEPSLQLIGTPEHRSIDLGILRDQGVRLVGRAMDAQGGRVALAPNLAESLAAADHRLARLLGRIDAHIARHRLSERVRPAETIRPIRSAEGPEALDLAQEGIRSVLWATGYRRSYPWLRVPVLDDHGEIRHEGGVTPAPGLYVLGLQFLRTRKSSLIDGVGADASVLAHHLTTRRWALARAVA